MRWRRNAASLDDPTRKACVPSRFVSLAKVSFPAATASGVTTSGVGELIRQAGLQLMELLMEEEVRRLVGERSHAMPARTASRWGSERVTAS